jgi:hypothetical protein
LHPLTSAPLVPPVQLPITLQPPAAALSHEHYNQGRPLLWDATLGQCVPGDDEALLRELQVNLAVVVVVVVVVGPALMHLQMFNPAACLPFLCHVYCLT